MQDRIAAGILDAAAEAFAGRGDVSMIDIAKAAGVGRATLYRYFPTREALIAGLLVAAVDDLSARIADADVDRVPVAEGIARLVRGFLSAGVKYAALASVDKSGPEADELDRRLSEPVRALLRRGAADGTLRDDIALDVQFEFFTGLLEKGLGIVARGNLGVEQASAAVVDVFLDGARAGS
jgi:TetR/AcrR family transcriptional regulator, mexCD-oprJ operon repressor